MVVFFEHLLFYAKIKNSDFQAESSTASVRFSIETLKEKIKRGY